MLAVTKEKMLKAGRDHLVLDRFPCVIRSFACLGKSEGLEGQRILVNLFIHVTGPAIAATWVPLGMNVPSENVKSFMALRSITTRRGKFVRRLHLELDNPHLWRRPLTFVPHGGSYPACAY
jgi:hypothetical protein